MVTSRQIVGVGLRNLAEDGMRPGENFSTSDIGGASAPCPDSTPGSFAAAADGWRQRNEFAAPGAPGAGGAASVAGGHVPIGQPGNAFASGSGSSSSSSNGSDSSSSSAGDGSSWFDDEWQSDEDGEEWAMAPEETEALCSLTGQPERCLWGSWASLPAGVQTASGPQHSQPFKRPLRARPTAPAAADTNFEASCLPARGTTLVLWAISLQRI